MINLLFFIGGSGLMLFNILYVVHRFRTWASFGELRRKYPRLNRMSLLYIMLLLCFFAGYVAITVLWIIDGYYQSKEAGIIAQILFWGAVFVKISNDNLFLLFQSLENDRMYQISNLQMSLDAYIDSIPGGVHHCIMNPDLAVSYVSEGFTDITGYDLDDIQSMFHGKYIGICCDEDDRNVLATGIRSILEDNSSATIVYKVRHKDGNPIWVSENMRAVKDSFGVTHIFAVLTDITLEKNMADTDVSTGLLNKRTFCSKARDYMRRHPKEEIGMFMIDLDNFKAVNDTFGHAAGDIAIKKTADYLRCAFSEKDCLIGRMGGDEFMVFVKNVTSEEELHRLQNSVYRDFNIELPDVVQVAPLSGSIGYVFARCEEEFEDIYHKADQAMYIEKAKRHAR